MLRKIAQNFGSQALALVVTFFDRFFVIGVLLRQWGAEVYGEWVYLLSLVGLLMLGELGLNIYYGNTLQKHWAAGRADQFQRIVAVGLGCSGLLAASLGLLALGFCLIADPLSGYGAGTLPPEIAYTVMSLLALTPLSRIARGAVSQVFRGRGEFAVGSLIDLAALFSIAIAAVTLALLGASPVVVAFAYAAGEIVVGWGLTFVVIRARYPDLRFTVAFPRPEELRDILRHLPWFAVQYGGPVAWLQLPVVYLGSVGVTGLPLVSFVALRTLVNFARSLCSMLSIALGVETAAIHNAGEAQRSVRMIMSAGQSLSMLTTAVASGIVLFGDRAVAAWTGRVDVFDPMLAAGLLGGTLLATPNAAVSMHLMLLNTPRPGSIALLCQLAIGLTGCVLLVPEFGVLGAVVALALGEAIGQACILPALAVRHMPGLDYPRYYAGCLARMLLVAGWCTGTGWACLFLTDFLGWSALLTMLLWCFAGVLPVAWVAMPERIRRAVTSRLWDLPAPDK